MLFLRPASCSAVLFAALTAWAGNEGCLHCDKSVEVNGDFKHFKIDGGVPVAGAPGIESAFREEIAGPQFTVTISPLPAGQYTVKTGEAEECFTDAGRRLFNIASGTQVIATNHDIFSEAGGARKVNYFIHPL